MAVNRAECYIGMDATFVFRSETTTFMWSLFRSACVSRYP